LAAVDRRPAAANVSFRRAFPRASFPPLSTSPAASTGKTGSANAARTLRFHGDCVTKAACAKIM